MKKITKFFLSHRFKFLMLLFVAIGGVIGVAAVTIYPSSEVSYNNENSPLNSTTVQGAIDELDAAANSCKFELSDSASSLMALGVTPVTTGDGLYADSIELERYIYKGANPNNYICLDSNTSGTCAADKLYRIFSIESDGTLKLIKENSAITMVFDADDATRRQTGYCSPYSFCNAWAAMSIFTNGDQTGVVAGLNGNTGDSSIKEYIDNTYAPTLANYSNMIVTKTWDIGGTAQNRDTLANAIADERKTTWNGKIALLTASEYVRANSNTETCGTLALLYDNDNICKSTNYLFKSSSSWWLLSPDSSYSRIVLNANTSGYVGSKNAKDTSGVRPVFYLKSGLNLTGQGTNDANVYRPERIPVPTYSESGTTVTITYPSGCGSKYTCSYSKDGGTNVNVTSTTANITFSADGNIVASVTHGTNTVYSSYSYTYPSATYVYAYHTDQKTIGTSTITNGVADYTQLSSYQNGHSNFLKYKITPNNIIEKAYACMKYSFISEPVCLEGGNSSYFESNTTILTSLQSTFNNNLGSCTFGTGASYCGADDLDIETTTQGNAYADDFNEDVECRVSYDGQTFCE